MQGEKKNPLFVVLILIFYLEQQPSAWVAWLLSEGVAERRWHLISGASPVVGGSSWRSTDSRHNSSHCLLTLLARLDGSCLAAFIFCWVLLPWFSDKPASLSMQVGVFAWSFCVYVFVFVCVCVLLPGLSHMCVGACLRESTATQVSKSFVTGGICNLATSPPPHVLYTAGLDRLSHCGEIRACAIISVQFKL